MTRSRPLRWGSAALLVASCLQAGCGEQRSSGPSPPAEGDAPAEVLDRTVAGGTSASASDFSVTVD